MVNVINWPIMIHFPGAAAIVPVIGGLLPIAFTRLECALPTISTAPVSESVQGT